MVLLTIKLVVFSSYGKGETDFPFQQKSEEVETNDTTKQEISSKPEVVKEEADKTITQHPATDIFRPLPMPPNRK